MLYLIGVPDGMRVLEAQLEEVESKLGKIDAMNDRLDVLPIQELMIRFDGTKDNVARFSTIEREDSSTGAVAQMKERLV